MAVKKSSHHVLLFSRTGRQPSTKFVGVIIFVQFVGSFLAKCYVDHRGCRVRVGEPVTASRLYCTAEVSRVGVGVLWWST